MKYKSLLFPALIAAIGCGPSSKQRTGEPPVVPVDAGDTAMNAAMDAARKSLDRFDRALGSPDSIEYFALKVRYDSPEGVEHIWMSDIRIEDNG